MVLSELLEQIDCSEFWTNTFPAGKRFLCSGKRALPNFDLLGAWASQILIEPLVAFLLLVVRPGAPSSVFAPGLILIPTPHCPGHLPVGQQSVPSSSQLGGRGALVAGEMGCLG